MGEVFKELLNLFLGDEPRFQKIVKFILALGIIITLVVILESAMGLITIGRLEREVNLLKELNTLTETGLGSQNQLEDIFNKAVSNLEQYNPDLGYAVSNMLQANNQVRIEEVLPGALIWILIAVFSLTTTERKLSDLKLSDLMVAVFFAIVGLGIGYIVSLIVETPNTILNIILSLCVGNIPLILIGMFFASRSQKQSQSKSDQPEDSNELENPKT